MNAGRRTKRIFFFFFFQEDAAYYPNANVLKTFMRDIFSISLYFFF